MFKSIAHAVKRLHFPVYTQFNAVFGGRGRGLFSRSLNACRTLFRYEPH
jgi:hypothetical protein